MFTYKSTNKFGAVAIWIDDFDRAKKELEEGNTVIYQSNTVNVDGYGKRDKWREFTGKDSECDKSIQDKTRDATKANYHRKWEYENRQRNNMITYANYKEVRDQLRFGEHVLKIALNVGICRRCVGDIKKNYPRYDGYKKRYDKEMAKEGQTCDLQNDKN